MDPQMKAAVRDLMVELRTQVAESELADATGWLIVCLDEETTRRTYHGPVESPEHALIAAAKWEAELNAANGPSDPPWRVTVEPCFSAVDLLKRGN